jgi:hypothetical protein
VPFQLILELSLLVKADVTCSIFRQVRTGATGRVGRSANKNC